MAQRKWIDLEEHGVKMIRLQAPSGAHYLVIGGKGKKDIEGAAIQLGFRPLPNNTEVLSREVQVNASGDMTLDVTSDDFMRAFPLARVVDFDPAAHMQVKTKQDVEAIRNRQKTLVGDATPIGYNRYGYEVLTSPEGRIVKDERGQMSLERETVPPNPGMFLRAVDADSLAACAEGLVEQASRSRILRADEFAHFLSVIYPDAKVTDEMREAARRAVEMAVPRWIARNGGRTLQEKFIAAGHLAENLAFLSDGRGAPLDGQVAPMAIVAQRVLGTEASLKGKSIVVSSPAPASLAALLPSGASVTAYAPDAKGASEVTQAFAATHNKTGQARVGAPDFAGADAVVLDLRRASGKAVKAAGIQFKRRDLAEALDVVAGRSGGTVLFLDAPVGPEEEAEMEAFRAAVAKTHLIEGEAHVDGALWRGRLDEPGRVMLSVGVRHDSESVLPPQPRQVHDWGSLWTWAAEVVMTRSRVASQMTDAESVELNASGDNLARNVFQTPYVSASRVGTPSTMVPRNLEGATKEALTRVAAIYGDIDAFVASEYGYGKEELGKYFSPEQVDALALQVYAEHRGRGFLVADQTGVGKGRTLAAMMRRSALKGETCFFITEREQNLSDIWRDIVATGSDHLFKPLVVNADAKVIDRNTKEVVLRGASREQVDAMVESKAVPEGVNLVMGTYSQFNRDTRIRNAEGYAGRDPAAKSRWLADVVGQGTRMFLDESHNASGDSNVSRNMTTAIDKSAGVVFSSATFAATSERMAFYRKLFPDDLSTSELSAMMSKGGETFQEVLSSMLVHDGVMIRREFDLSKVTFETVLDTARYDRNRALMDSIAPVLAEMAALSGEMDRRILDLNQHNRARELAEEAEEARRAAAAEDRDGWAPNEPGQAQVPAVADDAEAQPAQAANRNRVKSFQISRMGFGSPLYTISRMFVAALKVDVVAEDAIESLKNGEKPIILVENTMQELLEELAEMDDLEDAVAVDFRALFHRTLRKMVTTTTKVRGGAPIKGDLTANDPVLAAKVESIRRMIDALPDLHVSVIDEVKRRIEEAGYTVDEITGRSLEVRNGRIMRRPANNPTVIKNDFNDGVIDALVINVSGSTGIDLHASSTFPDQRRRVMMELQSPADILRKLQAHGRVNRYDQVVDPRVKSYVSGLPIEMRLSAMENAKLRKLSANTTSNRDAAHLSRDVPDLINPVGDVVCSRYAEARPDLMRRLGLKVSEVEAAARRNAETDESAQKALAETLKGGKAKGDEIFRVTDTKRKANDILARLIMLPVDMQTRVCEELTAEFNAAIEELESRGETPLRTNELSGIVHESEKVVFDGADVETPDSMFHEPLYIMRAALERTAEPIRSDDLAQRIELGEMASGRAVSCIQQIRDGMEETLAPHLPEGVATVADAIARNIPDIVARKQRLERLADALATIKPGREISYTVDESVVQGYVTRVIYPDRGYEHVPGFYGVEFAVPGAEKLSTMRIETLIKDPNFKIGEGLESENYDKILKRFDDASLTKLTTVTLLTHNIYRAMRMNVEHRIGPLVTFKMADGTVHRGIAVSKRHRDLKVIPVEMASSDMAYDAVLEGAELNGSSGLDEKTFSIRMGDSGSIEIRLPSRSSRKYGFLFDSPRILDLLKLKSVKDTTVKSGTLVRLTRDEFREALGAFDEVGAKFWCSPIYRDWSLKWLAGRHGNEQDVAPEQGREMAL